MVHVVTNFGVIEAESYLMDDSFAGDDVLSMLLTRKPIRQKNRSRKEYSKSAARAAMKDGCRQSAPAARGCDSRAPWRSFRAK